MMQNKDNTESSGSSQSSYHPTMFNYQKMEHKEHIYKLPDTYIGSISQHTEDFFVKSDTTESFEKKTITYIPGFLKIFDEILVNAIDHKQRDSTVKNIKIFLEKGKSEISIQNDGNGIDICFYEENKKNKEEKVYIPELLFCHLLTSTNYNPNEKRTTGGKNGYGSKLTCIFSKSFIIETVDANRKLKYIQKILNNNLEILPPKITKYSSKPYTKISFIPDYDRFELTQGITDDIYKLLEKRVYDVTATTPDDISVFLNGNKIKIKTLSKYSELYFDTNIYKLFYQESPRWKIGLVLSPNREYSQVSFVNGIWTMKGGKHVDYILSQIIDKIKNLLSKNTKTKGKTFRINQIKDNIWLFIDSIIENPSFTSQTKEELTTKTSQFGSTLEVDEKIIEKFVKYSFIDEDKNEDGFINRMIENIRVNDSKSIKKTDGTKKSVLKGIPKLEDAFFAGTRRSLDCTLILTEGDSAKASVLSGLSILGPNFREKYGIFPLRGKFLNVRDCGVDKISNNEEVKNLKTILGLQQGKVYTKENLKELRYGSISITTDADHDGSHIKGLLLNFIHYFWPSLLQIDGFIKTIITPIVKGFKNQQSVSFFTLKEFNEFKEQHLGEKWEYKYYKGLGTSTGKEFKEYFKKLKDITVEYRWETKNSSENSSENSLIMAFSKDKSDVRKKWLETYDMNDTIEYKLTDKNKFISLSDFIHRELKHFSNYDNIRSIPNIIDGFKPSQRKVIYGLLHKNPKEIKVAQLASFISEFTSYHHGEVSLEQTIINLAQSFVGKNNLPLLCSKGQFGTTLLGGKDHAQSRYIYTCLQKWTTELFNTDDEPLLEFLEDDGKQIEPKIFYPILPIVLINGVDGIGTGYSTSIPQFNPIEICESIIDRNNDNIHSFTKKWIPFYKGFKGTITEISTGFNISGEYKYDDTKNQLVITELPIGLWTQTFKELLEKHIENNIITSYVNKSTDENVYFEINLTKSMDVELIEKTFKLKTKLSLNNMYLYKNNTICKFNNIEDILNYYYTERLEKYEQRKRYILQKLNNQLNVIKEKVRFIQEVMTTPELVFRQTKNKIRETLESKNYIHIDSLLNIPIFHWSEEKISELLEQQQKIFEKIETLGNKTPQMLWNEDLHNLKKLL